MLSAVRWLQGCSAVDRGNSEPAESEDWSHPVVPAICPFCQNTGIDEDAQTDCICPRGTERTAKREYEATLAGRIAGELPGMGFFPEEQADPFAEDDAGSVPAGEVMPVMPSVETPMGVETEPKPTKKRKGLKRRKAA